ncbi:MAG: hypothetical protein GY714_24750 [Desulfobacterales bacterium]|nr:hypothetical protein [Desulfobacterales bacterium]
MVYYTVMGFDGCEPWPNHSFPSIKHVLPDLIKDPSLENDIQSYFELLMNRKRKEHYEKDLSHLWTCPTTNDEDESVGEFKRNSHDDDDDGGDEDVMKNMETHGANDYQGYYETFCRYVTRVKMLANKMITFRAFVIALICCKYSRFTVTKMRRVLNFISPRNLSTSLLNIQACDYVFDILVWGITRSHSLTSEQRKIIDQMFRGPLSTTRITRTGRGDMTFNYIYRLQELKYFLFDLDQKYSASLNNKVNFVLCFLFVYSYIYI